MEELERLISVAHTYAVDGALFTAAQRLTTAATLCQEMAERKQIALAELIDKA